MPAGASHLPAPLARQVPKACRIMGSSFYRGALRERREGSAGALPLSRAQLQEPPCRKMVLPENSRADIPRRHPPGQGEDDRGASEMKQRPPTARTRPTTVRSGLDLYSSGLRHAWRFGLVGLQDLSPFDVSLMVGGVTVGRVTMSHRILAAWADVNSGPVTTALTRMTKLTTSLEPVSIVFCIVAPPLLSDVGERA
jgi:hypothetical protein